MSLQKQEEIAHKCREYLKNPQSIRQRFRLLINVLRLLAASEKVSFLDRLANSLSIDVIRQILYEVERILISAYSNPRFVESDGHRIVCFDYERVNKPEDRERLRRKASLFGTDIVVLVKEDERGIWHKIDDFSKADYVCYTLDKILPGILRDVKEGREKAILERWRFECQRLYECISVLGLADGLNIVKTIVTLATA